MSIFYISIGSRSPFEPAICLNHAPLAAKSGMPNLGPLVCLAGTIRRTPESKTVHSKEWNVAVASRDRAPHLPVPAEQYLPPFSKLCMHAYPPLGEENASYESDAIQRKARQSPSFYKAQSLYTFQINDSLDALCTTNLSVSLPT